MPDDPRNPPDRAGSEVATRKRLVAVARGEVDADLIISGVRMLNVHALVWETDWDIVISGERIAWTGPSGAWTGTARDTLHLPGLWAVPGFGEAHKHIESTMLSPEYEGDLVMRYGTTWTVEASHEFSNVDGLHNVEFWKLSRQYGSPYKIFPTLGSATPPTGWEESGGYYGYREIFDNIEGERWVTGLDEVMDWAAIVDRTNPGHDRLWATIAATLDARGVVEGHGAGLTTPRDICAFAAAGISADHEVLKPEEAWDKLARGIFLEIRPHSREVLSYLVEKGLRDWSNVCVTTDDRNAETTMRWGAMDYNVRTAIEAGVPSVVAYSMGSLNPARHHRIDHLVGSLAPGRFADIVLLTDPETVVIDSVYADGRLVARNYKPVEPVPTVPWPEWATRTVDLGRKIEAADFVVAAPEGRDTVTAALLSPFHFEPDFLTATLPVEDGIVQRDAAQQITKVALLDRHSGKTRVSRMFWTGIGMRTPDSAVCCSIVHDNHNSWAIGSTDAAMAIAVNAMAEMDGGYVVVREGVVTARVRLEIGGLMTARPAEAFIADLHAMRAELDKMDWFDTPANFVQDAIGVDHAAEAMIYAFLTCPPWHWTFIPPTDKVPQGLINIRTGQVHPVVW